MTFKFKPVPRNGPEYFRFLEMYSVWNCFVVTKTKSVEAGIAGDTHHSNEEDSEDKGGNSSDSSRSLVRKFKHSQEHHHEESNKYCAKGSLHGVGEPMSSEVPKSSCFDEILLA